MGADALAVPGKIALEEHFLCPGFEDLPMQDAVAAADELERCLTELKFCGAMINGHTHGRYLDDPALFPFWERAEALGALIYLHPADPVAPMPVLDGHKGLKRAT